MTPSRNPLSPTLPLLEESFRWYGPADPVPLAYIRQAGAVSVYTALHDIPYGAVWPREAIRERKALIERAGLRWAAVESVPVHEDIRTRTGRCEEYLANYAQTLRHLGAEGVRVVVYNFMPVLDWVRTDLEHPLPDGSTCLHFDPVRFGAFEIHALGRPGAEADYTPEQRAGARRFWESLDPAGRDAFVASLIEQLPGCKSGFTLDGIRAMLAKYADIDRAQLKANCKHFLEAVIPAAEEAGVSLAVHPDDPPRSILGLPRIVSSAEDLRDLLAAVPARANGLCFCTGSFSAGAHNDVPAMIREFADRIHAVHLRVTRRFPDGAFYEDNHLEGSIDMVDAVQALLDEQKRRQSAGLPDWQLSFRPDHGHRMMDDLKNPPVPNPGYSCIGRMRGLAELRGLQFGLARAKWGR